MAHHYSDLILTKSFTPKEPQVELFETACHCNTIVSLVNAQGKKFICCKIIEHFINYGTDNCMALYLVASSEDIARHADRVRRLTCCSVAETTSTVSDQVLVTTVDQIFAAIESREFPIERVNILIIHECHMIATNVKLQKLLEFTNLRGVRVLGLAGTLLPALNKPYTVETEIFCVESLLHAKLDTASDYVTILQYGARPKEHLVEYSSFEPNPCSREVHNLVMDEIAQARAFFKDHTFARLECEGFDDDKILVPDPTTEPINILNTLSSVLQNYGLCAANKAAFILLGEIELLKMKTLYERHFLLLGAVTTVIVKIRAILDGFFELMDMSMRLKHYLAPKILRLFEMIALFRNKSSDRDLKMKEKPNIERNNDDCVLDVEVGTKFNLSLPKAKRMLYSENRLHEWDPNTLCGLILVDDDFTARLLFYLLNDLKRSDEEFEFLKVHFTLALTGDFIDGTALEKEYRKQELVLKNFRMRECNLLIGTSFLETGIDLPKCNLVVRFDSPQHFTSYAQGKARARGPGGIHCILTTQKSRIEAQNQLASYHAIEQMLVKKGKKSETDCDDDLDADHYNTMIKPFCPQLANHAPYVDLSSAITLLNRYCSKLPSDTFTRLTPIWCMHRFPFNDGDLYVCKLRLPINSPVKTTISGPAMPTPALARRFAALQTCLTLQKAGELDESLLPITKETFWMREEDSLGSITDPEEDLLFLKNGFDVRPGTTKRRQYYNKRIAECLTDCRPVAGSPCYLYLITMTLTCPLPEEQNTRGRKIRAPEDSPRGFGILTSRLIPNVGAFPIFTRAGEVAVELYLSPEAVILTPDQIEKIVPFINFTFTSVLRLQKYLMMFDPDTSENAYFIIPTIKDNFNVTSVDWDFLNLIYETRDSELEHIPDCDRENFEFEPEKYNDAVVCPWYRNQDYPQYFYVAEICDFLTPEAEFPGDEYATFEEYYLNKYEIQIQNHGQALLDVDHTSARLNFLTPRYVNRKGVALPTTSEAKKRAKRENLGQKQILVPELCYVHPFPASLWQKAVCLPCILHRLNALLLADEVRRLVARDLGLGEPGDVNIAWKPLDFGWNLADVLQKSREAADLEKVKPTRRRDSIRSEDSALAGSSSSGWMEVGTWSNDQADQLCGQWPSEGVRYGSPTIWMNNCSSNEDLMSDSMSDSDASQYSDTDSEDDSSLDSGNDPDQRLHIEFKEKFLAEAVEPHRRELPSDDLNENDDGIWQCDVTTDSQLLETNRSKYQMLVQKISEEIETDGTVCKFDEMFSLPWLNVPNSMEISFPLNLAESATSNNNYPEISNSYDDLEKNLPYAAFIRQSLFKSRVLKDIDALSQNAEDSVQVISNDTENEEDNEFSFDAQPKLSGHPGPNPSLILQALTMSNANDGINLERLETIGDSFLKFAITTFLYCSYENVHEGKLSHLRSKQVSNLNLYRLGKQKVFAESMVATKFEPHDNWLPPCYFVPRELEIALIEAGLPANHWNRIDLPALHSLGPEEVARLVRERGEQLGFFGCMNLPKPENDDEEPCFIPYNLMTQHSIPDKSVADCVEALIGAYLVACGPRGALLFMSWLGIKVLPQHVVYGATDQELLANRVAGHTLPVLTGETGDRAWCQLRFGELKPPKPPLLRQIADPEGELSCLLTGFDAFERELQYRFRDRSYLLQAVTHASYSVNQLTDCYQRLEFLGDAVLDYLITRHLYEDSRHHSPGSLTDLRSALVNNTIFASLAVRHGFHRFFRHHCPALHEVLDRFVRIQQENNHAISDECYLVEEDESEAAEDVEVPKALGDVFESVAGAIFLDSSMSLNAVWRVYYRIMKMEIDTFSTNVPKSPIRELLELEPETAQFGKPEKLADGRRVRVAVEIFGKGVYKGIGRNYRIAKCTAAKCALKQLKRRGLIDNMK